MEMTGILPEFFTPDLEKPDLLAQLINETLDILSSNKGRIGWSETLIDHLNSIKNKPYDSYLTTKKDLNNLLNELYRFNYNVRYHLSVLSDDSVSIHEHMRSLYLLSNGCSHLNNVLLDIEFIRNA